MNRNKVFMLSYIAFIITSIVVRFFYDYPLWNNIVIAVTISGVLFSYAEMVKTLCDDFDNRKSKRLKHCEAMLKKSKRIDSLINNLLSQKNSPDDEEQYMKELEQNNELIEHLQKMKGYYSKKRTDTFDRIIYYILLFTAFFSLLCIIAFDNLARELIKIQNYATVIAFVFILLTPFISDIIKEHEQKALETDTAFEALVAEMEDCYKEELEHHAD